jgi:hypothetical protein
MSAFSFRLPIGTSDFFNDIPKAAKRFLRESLNVAARVHQQHARLITTTILESAASGTEPKASDLSTQFGLNDNDGQSLLGAISFLVLILSKPDGPESVSTIVDELRSAGILDPAAEGAVSAILNGLDHERPAVAAAFRRSNLASRLLPSLTDLSFVVDVRVDFDGDRIALAIPVVLVHIDTDTTDNEIRFQMNKRQLEVVIEDLKKTLSRVEAAEKWAQGQPA